MPAPARSVPLAVAAALTGAIGASFALVGVLLGVLALGALPAPGVAPARGVLGLVAILLLLAAAVAGAAAGGLWARRAWGWAASVAVGSVALAGALTALATSGLQVPLLAGTALVVAALGALSAPATRREAGVGSPGAAMADGTAGGRA